MSVYVQYTNIFFFSAFNICALLARQIWSHRYRESPGIAGVTLVDTLGVEPGDLLGQEDFLKHLENAGFQCLSIRCLNYLRDSLHGKYQSKAKY